MCACMYVCVVCNVCMCVCVLRMCAYAELRGVCICVQKRKRDKTITCFKVCVLTHHSAYVYMHVWGVHVYICSVETSLSS